MHACSHARQGSCRMRRARRDGLARRLALRVLFTLAAVGLVAASGQAPVSPDVTEMRRTVPPAPTLRPTRSPSPLHLLWPPGTTAETYRFSSVTKTVTDVQALLQEGVFAARAFDVLDQLDTRDLVDALKLLNRQHGTVDALRQLPQAASFPGVAGAAAAVEDPEGFVLPAGVEGERRAELEAFRKVRQWPMLLPRKVVGLDATQEAVNDFIRRERSMIPGRTLE